MMRKHKIKVHVEIVEYEGAELNTPTMGENGSFEITLSEKDSLNIDTCEHALLRTAHPALRAAISKHLTEVSKKKPLSKAYQGQ
jgi:hypothetical protein